MKIKDLAMPLNEVTSPEVKRMYSIARTAPKTREKGWVGNKTFHGTSDQVTLKIDPTDLQDTEDWQRYACHTHPEGSSPFPSVQDLNAFSQLSIKPVDELDPNSSEIMGIVVFCGKNYVKLRNKRLRGRLNTSEYERAVQSNDVEGAIAALESMGFEVETDTL